MALANEQSISELLQAWSQGDEEALGRLVTIAYPELRRIARLHLFGKSPGHSLESAAVANEAYLRLLRTRGIHCENRVHFLALCAQVIRRVLVDHARSQRYAKRGGDAILVTLDEKLLGTRARGVEMLALEDALEALFKVDARKGRVVEMRFFGGLSVEETAEVLHVSPETVMRDWQMAKTWLFRELTRTAAVERKG